MSAIRTLLTGLVDYAGLFPPAALEMEEAVAQYAEHLQSAEAWALGRFIVPASAVGALVGCKARLGTNELWKLSLLGTPAAAGAALKENLKENEAGCVIESVESKVATATDVREQHRELPTGIEAWFEVPLEGHMTSCVAACAQTGVHAKVRTGGLSPEMIPSSATLAHFMAVCCRARVAFKATAGLHHPVRSVHALSSAPDAPAAAMHGFANVFLAATLLWAGGSEAEAVATLEETQASAFSFGQDAVRWHDHVITIDQLGDARQNFAISFGSCSFVEPIGDLKALAWL